MSTLSFDDALVWRYMSFGRFVWMLQSKRLWLSRVDLLGDEWEMRLAGNQLQHVIATHPPTPIDRVPEDPMERAARIIRHWRLTSFVNCWSAQEHESHALWRVFCPTVEGVAIRSTLAKLRGSVDQPLAVHKVNYGIPGNRARTPTREDLITQKRRMFEYEHEFRLVLTENSTEDEATKGIELQWDPEIWVESIRIHPEADRPFFEAAERVVEHFAPALKAVIQPSAMSEKPPF